MKTTDLKKLEREVDDIIAKIDAILGKRAKRSTLEHDDSTEAADIDAASNPSLDDSDNADDQNNDIEGGDEEEDDGIGKLLPITTRSKSTEFDNQVEFIRDRDGISKTEAMSRAREEFPDDYKNHQRVDSDDGVGKAAPVAFEDLVAIEMRKGCNETVAAQRVINVYGGGVLRNGAMRKRSVEIENTFADVTEEILGAEGGSGSRCEALREARLSNPRLFKALQTI